MGINKITSQIQEVSVATEEVNVQCQVFLKLQHKQHNQKYRSLIKDLYFFIVTYGKFEIKSRCL